MGCACTKQSRGTPDFQHGRKSKKSKSSSAAVPLPLPVSRQGSVRHSDLSGRLDSNGNAIRNAGERERERRSRQQQKQGVDPVISRSRREQQRLPPNPPSAKIPKQREGEQVAAGWPAWLSAVAGEAIKGWIPRRADSFEKLAKIGQGTYSNVYKARDIDSGKIVALKKVRFDNLEPESVRFMAREILILRRLDHPNVIKLEGLVTSRMSCSLYLVFEYMEHDLAGLAACPDITFTEPQVKCYMHQLLSGMEHCHNRGVLHRDIKGSNLLLDNDGILKIADFGLATFYHPNQKQPMTSRVVTLWYRPPELLLGATEYGVAVDLWSTGCILAELLAGKPIMPGRTEVEQLHKIFKLCGSPSEEYWKKSKLPHATIFKPQQPYKRCIAETFRAFPASALALLEKLLAIEPSERGSASSALKSEFFTTKPYACIPSSLPKYPPSKEMDAKVREEEARRQRAAGGKAQCDTAPKRGAPKDRTSKAVPAPEANAELPVNLQKRRLVPHSGVKSKSEKFPPPHEDSAVGFLIEPQRQGQPFGGGGDNRVHLVPPPHRVLPPTSVSGPIVHLESGFSSRSGPMGNPPSMVGGLRRKKENGDDIRMAPPRPPSTCGGDPVSLTSSRSHAASSNNDLFRAPPKNADIECQRSERLKPGEVLLDPPREIHYRRNRRPTMKPPLLGAN